MVDKPAKTYKRETFWGMFVVWLAFAAWGAWGQPAAVQIAELMFLPMILFGGGVFGLDAMAKQITIR